MCYDVRYLTKRLADYERRYGDLVDVDEIAKKIDPSYKKPMFSHFHSNGFSHELLPVVTSDRDCVKFMSWGLIPEWIKSAEDADRIRNSTLNARGDELFDKPSYKAPATTQRCVLLLDGYYEHHHRSGKTFPYHIQRVDRQPMSMAGLWSSWISPDNGEHRQTVSIVTTVGNELMTDIHNNPKLSGPRMPVILDAQSEKEWIRDVVFTQNEVDDFLLPYPSDALEAYPVRPLKGKNGVGNRVEATQAFQYPELQKGLFDM